MKNILRTWLRQKPKENKDWSDITLNLFIELTKYGNKLTIEDAFRIIYNIDYNNLSLVDLNKYNFNFLKTDIPREKIKKYYKLNGVKYYASFDTTKMTTAQFVDFQNYNKTNDIAGCLSVCMRPKNTEYNDGNYSIDKLKEDVGNMSITQVMTITFFFKLQLTTLFQVIQLSLENQAEEMKDKKLAEIIKQVDLANLVFSL